MIVEQTLLALLFGLTVKLPSINTAARVFGDENLLLVDQDKGIAVRFSVIEYVERLFVVSIVGLTGFGCNLLS